MSVWLSYILCIHKAKPLLDYSCYANIVTFKMLITQCLHVANVINGRHWKWTKVHSPAGADGISTNAGTEGVYQRGACKMKERRKKVSIDKCKKVGIDKSKQCWLI